jgi:hypothetical protein
MLAAEMISRADAGVWDQIKGKIADVVARWRPGGRFKESA